MKHVLLTLSFGRNLSWYFVTTFQRIVRQKVKFQLKRWLLIFNFSHFSSRWLIVCSQPKQPSSQRSRPRLIKTQFCKDCQPRFHFVPLFRFHFFNTSFPITLRFKHPCCICFHIALVFPHLLCYVVTFTISLYEFSPIRHIFIKLMSPIKNLMKRQTGFASFHQSKVLYGRMSWDWSISYNIAWHGIIVKVWYICMVRWAR